jgi:phosphoribosylformylglycinamidine synthase II
VEHWSDSVAVVEVRRRTLAELATLSDRRGLGFDRRELGRIRAYFRGEGREPTDVELAGLAQSWSEHCSYKSSRPFLVKEFRGLRPPSRVLGTGDAGVMRFPGGAAYALRIESHNHPSAVEPYGGAATGIGGILRDVLAVGAQPIGLTDPLFFGPLELADAELPSGVKSPRYLAEGVIAGIRDYGNRVGVPTVSGGVYFDPSFVVNPLVNVGCVGFLPDGRLVPNRARAAGDRLILAGGRTGRDGIGGVAFASKELSRASGDEDRGAVQLGNPILKEPLIRASIAAYREGLVAGVKDLGGGGLATASGELVHAGGFGSRIELADVPLREAGLKPWEVWISESQERMLYDVPPNSAARFVEIFREHDVPVTDIGEVIAGEHEELWWKGAPAARLRLGFRVAPPTVRRPARRGRRVARPTPKVPDDDLASIVERLVLAPDSLSRESVVRVYDHEVQGRTAIKPLHGRVTSPSHGDAAVLQPDPARPHGLAVTTAAQPWACAADPYVGAMLVVEEAARNLFAVGARPDAFSDCLNFGNPNDPAVTYDFARATAGLASAARALGFAVPSGNVSLYNGGLGRAIPPTPVLLATGIVDDLDHAVTSDLKESGNPLYVVGTSRPELGGSLWARLHRRSDLRPPAADPALVRRLGTALLKAGRAGAVAAAHDVSDGGLAVTLAEMAFGGGLGFEADLAATDLGGPGSALVVEGASRWVVEVRAEAEHAFARAFRGLPCRRLGAVTDRGGRLLWNGAERASVDLELLYRPWRSTLNLP